MHTQDWFPVELHEKGFSFFIDKTVSVNTESFHHPEAAWDTRSLISHITLCMVSGVSDTKSQKVS